MSLSTAPQPVPLQLDPHGVARIGGTRVTLDSVIAVFKQGATPEEIAESFTTLSLADIYFVLGYYLQHRGEVEAYLEKRHEEAEAIRTEAERRFNLVGLRERLLARKQLKDSSK
ncbi:MAG: DUF433 domain-containing protein [Pirellulales bacterium]